MGSKYDKNNCTAHSGKCRKLVLTHNFLFVVETQTLKQCQMSAHPRSQPERIAAAQQVVDVDLSIMSWRVEHLSELLACPFFRPDEEDQRAPDYSASVKG